MHIQPGTSYFITLLARLLEFGLVHNRAVFLSSDLLLQRDDGTLCSHGGGAVLIGLLRKLIDAPRSMVILILELLYRYYNIKTCFLQIVRKELHNHGHANNHAHIAHLNTAGPVGFVQLPVAIGFAHSLFEAFNSFL